jgi:hypothetical protein
VFAAPRAAACVRLGEDRRDPDAQVLVAAKRLGHAPSDGASNAPPTRACRVAGLPRLLSPLWAAAARAQRSRTASIVAARGSRRCDSQAASPHRCIFVATAAPNSLRRQPRARYDAASPKEIPGLSRCLPTTIAWHGTSHERLRTPPGIAHGRHDWPTWRDRAPLGHLCQRARRLCARLGLRPDGAGAWAYLGVTDAHAQILGRPLTLDEAVAIAAKVVTRSA